MTNLNEVRPSEPAVDVSRFENSNALLESCLELVLKTDDPDEGMEKLLQMLGTEMGSDRVYVFQVIGTDQVSNTYEWCRAGVSPQKELLQMISRADVADWFRLFDRNESVVIEDLETLRKSDPLIYTYLKPQNIRNLLAGRIFYNNKVAGFLGFDNLEPEKIRLLEPVISHIGKIVATQIMRIDIFRQLQEMDLRDPETGLYNLKAMCRHNAYDQSCHSMGVIYGHMGPDDLKLLSKENLQVISDRLMDFLETGRIYRISPEEFVAIYINIPEDSLDNLRRKLKFSEICRDKRVNIGSAWSDQFPALDTLIQEAKRWSFLCGDANHVAPKEQPSLYRYMEKNYFDLGFFLDALTNENESGYFFFGDMLNDVYYVSDNLARKFGLTGNLIRSLPQFWAERIKGKMAQERYRREVEEARTQGRDQMDVYHQVHTTEGHMEWVRCYVRLKWNQDRTQPLFCAGRLTMQDVSLLVDCATNFNWETVLCRNLSKIREDNRQVRIIGFSFNDIAKVNNMQGRAFGDNLIHSVSEALTNRLSDRVAFYKLSGMRCAGLIRNEYQDSFPDLIQEMRRIIEEKYHNYGIEVPNSCSFAVLDFPRENVGTLDFVEDLNNCVKMAQREIAAPYVDGRNLDIRKIQESANMALELGRDVINQMRNFRLVIQPVVSTVSGQVIAGEALLRWRSEGKNISPGLFIPILEHENMIQSVGRWVLEESVKICRRIVSFQPEFHLSVNVSLRQLDDPGFLEFIQATLQKYNLDGSHIILEITESCMDKEQEKLMHFVNYCQTLKIKVALDDFGTGYSSIRVLMQYPTAIIKLDRSLLLEMGKSADKLSFISSIVYACHQFGKQVCIEGVETKEQCELVKQAQCDMIQGFYYYRPMEVEDVYRMLAQRGSIIAEPAQ